MSNAQQVYIDGKLCDEADAKVSVFDHGLLYGDGVFEGIRFYNGRVFKLKAHIDRLFDSAKAIQLTVSLSHEEVTQAVMDTIRANGLRDGYVRLLVTRGVGSLGLNPFLCEKSSVIIIASKIALYDEEKYQQGLTVVTCGTRRPAPAALSPSVKSLNYLNNIMAKIEAINAGAEEGVMLNEQGFVAECTGDNVFVVKDHIIYTPPVTAGGLNGITRRIVMDLAREEGFELREQDLTRYELYTADEFFLSGTAAEVVPVATYDGRIIGEGKPGPITLRLMEFFRELTQTTGEPIYD
ncbi:MAG: branched-chain-amino-acid transaminase [Verrucomicrobiales bacterium]|nr:branched-chain-amino-acid transaminase [Verrucomicrobiales bacterium]